MKQFLLVLAIGAVLTSCNNGTPAEKVDAATSTVVENATAAIDSTKQAADSTIKAVVDSANVKIDSLKK